MEDSSRAIRYDTVFIKCGLPVAMAIDLRFMSSSNEANGSNVSDQSPWLAVAIAIVGTVGTVAAGMIGYQTGAKAVDKDYVQMAITNLGNKDASPELRNWSVQILNKLAPVPLGEKLKEQLSSPQYILPTIAMPKVAEPCPDLIKQDKGKPFDQNDIEAHNKLFKKFIMNYEECRIKHDMFSKYIRDVNAAWYKESHPVKK